MMLVQIAAAALLTLGSALIFHALLRLETTAESSHSPAREAAAQPPAKPRDLPRAA